MCSHVSRDIHVYQYHNYIFRKRVSFSTFLAMPHHPYFSSLILFFFLHYLNQIVHIFFSFSSFKEIKVNEIESMAVLALNFKSNYIYYLNFSYQIQINEDVYIVAGTRFCLEKLKIENLLLFKNKTPIISVFLISLCQLLFRKMQSLISTLCNLTCTVFFDFLKPLA
jgi:hypothetical protein